MKVPEEHVDAVFNALMSRVDDALGVKTAGFGISSIMFICPIVEDSLTRSYEPAGFIAVSSNNRHDKTLFSEDSCRRLSSNTRQMCMIADYLAWSAVVSKNACLDDKKIFLDTLLRRHEHCWRSIYVETLDAKVVRQVLNPAKTIEELLIDIDLRS